MRAGTLRERVTIQRPSTVSNPQWGPSPTWDDIAVVSASVEPRSAAETFNQKGVESATQYTVRVRYRPDVTTADRLAWQGKVLDIAGVVPDVRRRELEIAAVEHGAQPQA